MDNVETSVKVIVIGVGGAGSNAVNRMIDDEMTSVDFFVMNTDLQSLQSSKVPSANRVLLGGKTTGGLGSGGDPTIGKQAAEKSVDEIRKAVKGANMVFIAAGMGGGTGTGAAPIIANICREEGALTVAIVTRPFGFEGKKRMATSVAGMRDLKESVDAVIIVSNDKLLMSNGGDSIINAFQESDRVLSQSVKTVTDLIYMPGIINLDFADVRNVLQNSGTALIGYGIGEGASKALDAANSAISSPLLEASISGARRAICAVTCGPTVSLYETQECINHIVEVAGNALDVKLGVSINEQLGDQILVSVIASDFIGDNDFNNTILDEISKPILSIKNEQEVKPAPKKIEKKPEKKEDDDILPSFLKNINAD